MGLRVLPDDSQFKPLREEGQERVRSSPGRPPNAPIRLQRVILYDAAGWARRLFSEARARPYTL